MKLYHVTTEKKARLYRQCGYIQKPVRGFTTGRSPAPRGGVWPWGCRGGAGAPPPDGGVKAPSSESSSALRAPGRSSGAPATGEFTTLQAAMAWAVKVGRKAIYEIEGIDSDCHKLPDHHNAWGEAWWIDADVAQFKCVFSAEKDA